MAFPVRHRLCPVLLATAGLFVHSARATPGTDPIATARTLAQQALKGSLSYDLTAELTTEFGPRLYGSTSERRAAAWAAARLEDFGCDRVWTEPFPVERGWARGLETATLLLPRPQPLAITALGGSVATPAEGLEAELAVFPIIDDLLAQPEGSLTGKIAVVTQSMAQGGYARIAGAIRSKGPSEAARRGAIAFLLRSAGTDHDRLPHTGATRYRDDVPRIPAAALAVPDAEQIDRLAARHPALRLRLVLTPRDLGTVQSQNVIAEIKGRERPDEFVLLGAHLDSWDLGTGAIDDGAGVGIVMAAAKLIRDLPQPPRRTIRFVLFGAEEIGLVGGRAYATAHAAELSRHMLATEADSGQGPVQALHTGVADPDHPSLEHIRQVLQPLGVERGRDRSSGGPDIGPLHAKGVPAVGLGMDTHDYFHVHHNANDTLDKVEPDRLCQSTAAFVVVAYLAAELDGDYRAPAP